MKKVYLTFTVVSVFGMLVFFGCSKEEAQNKEKQESVFQPSEKDLQIEGKILEFQTTVDYARANPNLKSGGDDLTLDETIWNIEALANYNYANASAEIEDYVGETAEIEVPLTDGKVSIADAVVAYDQMIVILDEHYEQVEGTEKHLVLADVTLKEIEGKTATFSITSGIGKGGSWNPFGDFGTTDYWTWGMLYGKCDGSGQGVGSDAAEQIQTKMNARISLPNGHKYFVDISVVYVDGASNDLVFDPDGEDPVVCESCMTNPNDPFANDNMYDYFIFRNHSSLPNFHDCLVPNEMNFYMDGMETITYGIAYDCFPTQLDGKIFASIDIDGEAYINYTTTLFHHAWINYGISVHSIEH